MFTNSYDIYNLTFSQKVREFLIKQPKLYVVISDTNIAGLRDYFIDLLNSLNSTYFSILSETNSSVLQDKINSLSYNEKIDICIFFKIKSYFNPKLKPSINSFCKLLGINTNKTLNKLFKSIINTTELSTPNLKFNLETHCVNCNSLINTEIEYLGSSNYTEKHIHCTNCNHKFLFKISDNKREISRYNFYAVFKFNTPICDCDSCKNWLNLFTSYISNNIETFKNELFYYIKGTSLSTITSNLSLEQLYKIHKNSLTKTETELLNLSPKNIDDIYSLIHEMNNRNQKKVSIDKLFENLIKHGIIYEQIDEDLLMININKYIDSYVSLLNLIKSNKVLEIFGGTYGVNPTEIAPPYSINYITSDNCYNNINFCSVKIDSIKSYHLNDFYFNSVPKIITCKKYNIFNSPAEATLFNHLNRMYPHYITCPNVPLRVFVKVTELSQHFTSSEIKYLKYCIIDFVIADIDGYVVKCIELQKGNHHNNKDWIYKDSLKRKCFEVIGVDFSYEY